MRGTRMRTMRSTPGRIAEASMKLRKSSATSTLSFQIATKPTTVRTATEVTTNDLCAALVLASRCPLLARGVAGSAELDLDRLVGAALLGAGQAVRAVGRLPLSARRLPTDFWP